MKKALIAIAATFVALSSYGQGLINFDTLAVDFQVKRADGSAPGAGVTAQLFQNNGGTLTALTPATTFLGTSFPAAAQVYTVPVDVGVAQAPGTVASIVFRAWEGENFDSSLNRGQTAAFNVTLGGGLLPAANLDALTSQSMSLQVVPEPSTIALGILGAAALLFRRRK